MKVYAVKGEREYSKNVCHHVLCLRRLPVYPERTSQIFLLPNLNNMIPQISREIAEEDSKASHGLQCPHSLNDFE